VDAGAASLAGRTCLVTGATSGIGQEIAVGLARLGATVGVVCRDRRRGEATLAELRRHTDADRVLLFEADLASQAEVRALAADVQKRLPALHVLVNNAGVVNLGYTTTVDGIETVFAVNHLAPFLLTNLLLDQLRASAPARVVTVASDAHKFVRGIDFDDLGHERRYRWTRVYGQSKLANVLFTAELARRLAGSGVTATCLHPGAVGTRLGQNNGWWAKLLTRSLRPFFRTPAQGADTAVYLASAPGLETLSGGYFVNRRPRRPSKAAEDHAMAARLWDVSARLSGLPTG
jgi:NAD(P)-dependent dehydrogenase (short-subunit alcohol dehydrogenase family)